MAQVTANCLVCGNPFTYEPALRAGKWDRAGNRKWSPLERRICDGCRRKNNQASKANYDEKTRTHLGLRKGSAYAMKTREIAQELHLSERAVEDVQRRALAKIKNSAGLQELWATFLAEGGQEVEAPGLGDPAALLLDYQLALADYWALHDKIAAYVCPFDTEQDRDGLKLCREALHEIELFQAQIGKFLEEW